MASYLVLTPPGAPWHDDKARFVNDRLSWLGFVFPAIWLLTQRQWIAGIVVALLQAGITFVSVQPGTAVAAFLIELALRLLVALEGPAFVARRLEAGGWTLRDIIPTDDLTTAEMLYDARHRGSQDPAPAWQHPNMQTGRNDQPTDPVARPAFGLFGSYGER